MVSNVIEMPAITIKVSQLMAAVEAYQRLAALPLNNKHAYHVKRVGKLVEVELERREKHRLSIVEEIGVERDATTQEKQDGWDKDKIKSIEPEQQAEYNRRLKEYDEQVVTLSWRPIPFEILQGHRITPADLMLLDTLIAEPIE